MATKPDYSLNIRNWGSDTYVLASKGHHDFEIFMNEVSERFPNWSMGIPEHLYAINVFGKIYVSETKTKKYFPITITREAYGSEKYIKKDK